MSPFVSDQEERGMIMLVQLALLQPEMAPKQDW